MYLESVTQINLKQSGLSLDRIDAGYSAVINIRIREKDYIALIQNCLK